MSYLALLSPTGSSSRPESALRRNSRLNTSLPMMTRDQVAKVCLPWRLPIALGNLPHLIRCYTGVLPPLCLACLDHLIYRAHVSIVIVIPGSQFWACHWFRVTKCLLPVRWPCYPCAMAPMLRVTSFSWCILFHVILNHWQLVNLPNVAPWHLAGPRPC